jgi:hypothetical protein
MAEVGSTAYLPSTLYSVNLRIYHGQRKLGRGSDEADSGTSDADR